MGDMAWRSCILDESYTDLTQQLNPFNPLTAGAAYIRVFIFY